MDQGLCTQDDVQFAEGPLVIENLSHSFRVISILQNLLLIQQVRSSVQVTNNRGVGVHWHTIVVDLVQHGLVLLLIG